MGLNEICSANRIRQSDARLKAHVLFMSRERCRIDMFLGILYDTLRLCHACCKDGVR